MDKKLILKTDPRNARLHPPRNLEAVGRSLDELGAGRSIVVDRDGVAIAGNAVLEKAKELGLDMRVVHTKGDKLVVVVRDDLATDDPKRKQLAIADNRISDLSDFDFPVLAEIFTELSDLGIEDFTTMGFEDFEVAPLLEGEFTPPAIDPDDAGAGKEPRTVICPKCGHEFEV